MNRKTSETLVIDARNVGSMHQLTACVTLPFGYDVRDMRWRKIRSQAMYWIRTIVSVTSEVLVGRTACVCRMFCPHESPYIDSQQKEEEKGSVYKQFASYSVNTSDWFPFFMGCVSLTLLLKDGALTAPPMGSLLAEYLYLVACSMSFCSCFFFSSCFCTRCVFPVLC